MAGSVALATVAGVAVGLTGCTKTATPSAAAFCRRIAANKQALQGPAGDAAALGRTLTAYRTVGQVAPIAVRDAWTTVTALIESAATADLTQPQASEGLAARALAAKPEIDAIVSYARTTCDLDLSTGLTAAVPAATTVPASTGSGDPTAVDPTATTADAPGTVPPQAGDTTTTAA